MYPLGFAELLAEGILRERLREAERERLARLARQPGRPLRARLAERLHALAARIDQPVQLESDIATA